MAASRCSELQVVKLKKLDSDWGQTELFQKNFLEDYLMLEKDQNMELWAHSSNMNDNKKPLPFSGVCQLRVDALPAAVIIQSEFYRNFFWKYNSAKQ